MITSSRVGKDGILWMKAAGDKLVCPLCPLEEWCLEAEAIIGL